MSVTYTAITSYCAYVCTCSRRMMLINCINTVFRALHADYAGVPTQRPPITSPLIQSVGTVQSPSTLNLTPLLLTLLIKNPSGLRSFCKVYSEWKGQYSGHALFLQSVNQTQPTTLCNPRKTSVDSTGSIGLSEGPLNWLTPVRLYIPLYAKRILKSPFQTAK
jgi:hypothetical protein